MSQKWLHCNSSPFCPSKGLSIHPGAPHCQSTGLRLDQWYKTIIKSHFIHQSCTGLMAYFIYSVLKYFVQRCLTLCTSAQGLLKKPQWTETLQSTQPCERTVIVMSYLCTAHWDQTKDYEGEIPHRPDIKTLRLAMWSGSGLPTPSTGVHAHAFIH